MPGKRPKQVRGDLLVDKVLEAALEQLSAKGYEGLSMDEVATQAGVNKTTIYRRWPDKGDLAMSALDRTADTFVAVEDNGSLRSDLISFLSAFRNFALSARGQTVMRMMLADDPGVVELAHSMRERRE